MLYLVGNAIQLTKGDTAHLSIAITNTSAKEPYKVLPTDTLILTVKKNSKETSPVLIQKRLSGIADFHFVPEDTSGLAVGEYVYDVELRTREGDIYTVIQCNSFQLLPEVTM